MSMVEAEMCRASTTPPPLRAAGFSLVELVIVIVIIGTLATIAIPRFMKTTERSTAAARVADATVLQRAVDLYTAEHLEAGPNVGPAGPSTDASAFIQRLTGKTLLNGTPNASGTYGPYLRDMPANPVNGKASIRINGAAAGANSHGWRYDSVKRKIEPDDSTATSDGRTGATEVTGATGGAGRLGGASLGGGATR